MPTDIEELLKAARQRPMTSADQESQRRSFAYGNAHIENSRVTREMVDVAANNIDR
jgi:hypothetical protein